MNDSPQFKTNPLKLRCVCGTLHRCILQTYVDTFVLLTLAGEAFYVEVVGLDS